MLELPPASALPEVPICGTRSEAPALVDAGRLAFGLVIERSKWWARLSMTVMKSVMSKLRVKTGPVDAFLASVRVVTLLVVTGSGVREEWVVGPAEVELVSAGFGADGFPMFGESSGS